MSATTTTSSSSSHTVYTTFLSVIPGLVDQVNSTGTVFTTHDQTMTVTVTDPAVYDAMVGYEAIPITSSSESTSESNAAAPDETHVPRAGRDLEAGSLAGIAIGCVVAVSMFILLGTLLKRKWKFGRRMRRALLEGQMLAEVTDSEIVEEKQVPLAGAGAGRTSGEEGQIETGFAELSNEGGRHELESGEVPCERSIEGLAELPG